MTYQSVNIEAEELTKGARNQDYGHPLDDFTKTVGMINALFAHKLKEPFTPEEWAMMQICSKLSRETNRPKRDNRVDIAGYAETIEMIKHRQSEQQPEKQIDRAIIFPTKNYSSNGH